MKWTHDDGRMSFHSRRVVRFVFRTLGGSSWRHGCTDRGQRWQEGAGAGRWQEGAQVGLKMINQRRSNTTSFVGKPGTFVSFASLLNQYLKRKYRREILLQLGLKNHHQQWAHEYDDQMSCFSQDMSWFSRPDVGCFLDNMLKKTFISKQRRRTLNILKL